VFRTFVPLSVAGFRAWPHDRARWFFSRVRWGPDELDLAVACLVAGLPVPAGEPVVVAIDCLRPGGGFSGTILVSPGAAG